MNYPFLYPTSNCYSNWGALPLTLPHTCFSHFGILLDAPLRVFFLYLACQLTTCLCDSLCCVSELEVFIYLLFFLWGGGNESKRFDFYQEHEAGADHSLEQPKSKLEPVTEFYWSRSQRRSQFPAPAPLSANLQHFTFPLTLLRNLHFSTAPENDRSRSTNNIFSGARIIKNYQAFLT